MSIERKYTLSKVRKGDYLLLSNDGGTMWRIAAYDEDGSAENGLTGRRIRGRFWNVWRYLKPVQPGVRVRTDDWNAFGLDDTMLKTREEAVQIVLRRSEREAAKH